MFTIANKPEACAWKDRAADPTDSAHLIIISCRDLIRDAPHPTLSSLPSLAAKNGCRELKGVGLAVSKSYHRAFGYRGKRNLITDFCDKERSAVPNESTGRRNKWGKPRAAISARGNAHRIEL